MSRSWWKSAPATPEIVIPEALWQEVVAALPVLQRLNEDELERLKALSAAFLQSKEFSTAHDYALDDFTLVAIAAQACLLVLNLGSGYYEGWVSIVVYPAEFIPEREFHDESGVVHTLREPMLGEAWEGGPLILSGPDVVRDGSEDGVNVVIHEFAHKLDMRNGDANGFPPLHSDMNRQTWSEVFQRSYARFCQRVDAGEWTDIDPYAAESPAEFFAVMSEAFFEIPRVLQRDDAELYEQLAAFYRQRP